MISKYLIYFVGRRGGRVISAFAWDQKYQRLASWKDLMVFLKRLSTFLGV